MPASGHDSSSTDAHSTTRDVSDDEVSDEDAESDYQSCGSYEDEERMAEDEELILQYIIDSERDPVQARQWEHVQASDVQDLVGDSRTSEWISRIDYDQWFDAVKKVGDRSRDAIAVLAETQEKYGSWSNYCLNLHTLLIRIMSSKTDTSWWKVCALYIPSQKKYHFSMTPICPKYPLVPYLSQCSR
ncbi:hypothetical protein BDZ89DRAFT_1136933 [Hymenopellis radicata]|nr:hypothetical protein BDZ89DRAFT_1136933 [Hymenopellis radicata]